MKKKKGNNPLFFERVTCMEYLSLGRVKDAFGLDGSLKIFSTTNMSNYRYQKGAKVFIYDETNDERKEYVVLNYRHNGLFDIIKLEGIQDIEAALSKKGMEIQVEKNREDLEEGYYFFSDLKGCKIIDKNENILGFVKEIEEFPAQITLRVSRQGKPDFFVPFIEEFIVNVDVDNKVITIKVIEGLL